MNFKLSILFVLCSVTAIAQSDSTKSKTLDSITVQAYLQQRLVRPLQPVQGMYLFNGKKSEVIELSQIPADIANKTGRQLFSKVPGLFVYDMDGSGNQLNIAARGLDPHRGWDFNVRKDGIITNSDMYGYPASHYSMPLESLSRIELVRGTGSLQYGAQFGGMLNYVSKQGDTTRPISFESINSAGSFKLLSTYNAIGGKLGRLKYYTYMQRKSRDGYRDNEHTDANAEGVILNYQAAPNLSIRTEFAHSKYIYRIPGPLTDSQFYANPQQATRSRNYYSPSIYVPSVIVNWQLAPQTHLQLTTSAVLGTRKSVLFDKPTNIADTINAVTKQYNNRQVDIDTYHSYTGEVKLLQHYSIGKQDQIVVAGIQYMNNDLHRNQLGKGTTGSDYNTSLIEQGWGRDIHLKTGNLAFYAENKFQLTDKFSVNLGGRLEVGETNMSGTISYYPTNQIPVSMEHHFPLFGANFSYRPASRSEIYGGWSQAYHPMLFKDLIPGSLYEQVDPNIRDAKGYNAEIGFRGGYKFLHWDVNVYGLQYNNRFGTLSFFDAQNTFYTYRTNIGNSFTKGMETLLQGDWAIGKDTYVSLFTSTAVVHARYTDATVKSGTTNVSVRGNKVESAPDLISRNGVTFKYKKVNLSALYSYTSSTYADALNTVVPAKTTGAVGLVPSYGLLDFNVSARISSQIEARVNVNNVLDKQYFTKRPTFYPGPGVWPSDGRNATATLAIRL